MIKITDREALRRILEGETLKVETPKLGNTGGSLRLVGDELLNQANRRAVWGDFMAPEPIRELTGWETVDALREMCCIKERDGNDMRYWMHGGALYVEHRVTNQWKIKSSNSLSWLLSATFTLCTPEGVPTNDKEAAK